MNTDDLFSFLTPQGSGSTSKSKSTETKEEKAKRKEDKKQRKLKDSQPTPSAPSSSASSSKRAAQDNQDERNGAEVEDASPAKRVRLAGEDADENEAEGDAMEVADRQAPEPVEQEPAALPVVADEFETEEAREVAPSAGLDVPTAEGAAVKLTHQVSPLNRSSSPPTQPDLARPP